MARVELRIIIRGPLAVGRVPSFKETLFSFRGQGIPSIWKECARLAYRVCQCFLVGFPFSAELRHHRELVPLIPPILRRKLILAMPLILLL